MVLHLLLKLFCGKAVACTLNERRDSRGDDLIPPFGS